MFRSNDDVGFLELTKAEKIKKEDREVVLVVLPTAASPSLARGLD